MPVELRHSSFHRSGIWSTATVHCSRYIRGQSVWLEIERIQLINIIVLQTDVLSPLISSVIRIETVELSAEITHFETVSGVFNLLIHCVFPESNLSTFLRDAVKKWRETFHLSVSRQLFTRKYEYCFVRRTENASLELINDNLSRRTGRNLFLLFTGEI